MCSLRGGRPKAGVKGAALRLRREGDPPGPLGMVAVGAGEVGHQRGQRGVHGHPRGDGAPGKRDTGMGCGGGSAGEGETFGRGLGLGSIEGVGPVNKLLPRRKARD